MKITIQQYDTIATVEVKGNDLTISDCFDDLIVPALLAIGYNQSIINECLRE